MDKHVIRWLALLAAALPAGVLLCCVLIYGVNVPVMDQWSPDVAGMFIKAHNGQLTLHDFLAQHNEHRILFPRLIFWALGMISHWNVRWEMVCEWFFVFITSLGIGWLCLQTDSPGNGPWWRRIRGRTLLKWFLCNVLIFTPAQWENALCGMGLCNVMPMALIVMAMVVVCSGLRLWTRTCIAVVLSGVAMYSAGNGVLAWPLVGVLLAWSSSRAQLMQKRWALAAWAGACVLLTALYFIGLEKPEAPPGQVTNTVSILTAIGYPMAFFGSPFAYATTLQSLVACIFFGILSSLALLVCIGYFLEAWLRRRDMDLSFRMLIWLMVAGFTVLSACIAGYYRAALGVAQGGSSRYVTFAVYLDVALINLIPMICRDMQMRLVSWREAVPGFASTSARFQRILIGVPYSFGTLLVVVQLLCLSPAYRDLYVSAQLRRQARGALMLAKILPNSPLLRKDLTFHPEALVDLAVPLTEIGFLQPGLIMDANLAPLAARSGTWPDRAAIGKLEDIGQLADPAGYFGAYGWAVCPGTERPADAVIFTYDDLNGQPIIFASAEMNQARNDLIAKKGAAFYFTGWRATAPMPKSVRADGRITIRAWSLDATKGIVALIDGEGTAKPD